MFSINRNKYKANLDVKSLNNENNSLHYCLEFIKSWKISLNFVVSSKMVRCFESSNKNRLKNIIKKFLNDSFLRVGIILKLEFWFETVIALYIMCKFCKKTY